MYLHALGRAFLFAVLATYTAAGCESAKRESECLRQRLTALPDRATPAEVDEAFQMPGRHQFTVKADEQECACLSYSLWESHIRLYAVFHDGRLVKLVEPPAFEVETLVVDRARVERRKAWTAESRVQRVLEAEPLSREALGRWIEAHRPRPSRSNLAPAMPLLLPTFLLGKLAAVPALRKYEELERRYDGRKLPLGVSREKLEASWGPPVARIATRDSADGDGEWIYGKDANDSSGLIHWPWCVVVLTHGKVSTIYSRDFVDEPRILRLTQPAPPPHRDHP